MSMVSILGSLSLAPWWHQRTHLFHSKNVWLFQFWVCMDKNVKNVVCCVITCFLHTELQTQRLLLSAILFRRLLCFDSCLIHDISNILCPACRVFSCQIFQTRAHCSKIRYSILLLIALCTKLCVDLYLRLCNRGLDLIAKTYLTY